MPTITIPKELIKKEKELILVPRKKYEELLNLEKKLKTRLAEELDTDLAIATYKKEKREGRLKKIRSLADLE